MHSKDYTHLQETCLKWIPRSKSGAPKSRPRWMAHTRIEMVWDYTPPRGVGGGGRMATFIIPLLALSSPTSLIPSVPDLIPAHGLACSPHTHTHHLPALLSMCLWYLAFSRLEFFRKYFTWISLHYLEWTLFTTNVFKCFSKFNFGVPLPYVLNSCHHYLSFIYYMLCYESCIRSNGPSLVYTQYTTILDSSKSQVLK